MKSNGYELSVLVETSNGKVSKIPEYGLHGRTYVEGRKGQKYRLQFKNNTSKRVLIIPSVDGKAVVDGSRATDNSRGYIIEAYASAEIKGWRTSLEDINRFTFEPKEQSYSAKAGDGVANCGVIGLIVYEENISVALGRIMKKTEHHHHHHHHHHDHHHYPEPTWPKRYPEIYWTTCGGSTTGSLTDTVTFGGSVLRSHSCGPIAGGDTGGPEKVACFMASASVGDHEGLMAAKTVAASEVPKFTLGTGMGDHEKDVVSEEHFVRGHKRATMELFYASGKELQRLGIKLGKAVALEQLPQAFASGFCKPV